VEGHDHRTDMFSELALKFVHYDLTSGFMQDVCALYKTEAQMYRLLKKWLTI